MVRVTGPSILLVAWCMLGGCTHSECLQIGALPGGPLHPAAIMYMYGTVCMGVPACTALDLGLYVEDLSCGGRPFTDPVFGNDIMHQFRSGSWEWVIMTGGARKRASSSWTRRR